MPVYSETCFTRRKVMRLLAAGLPMLFGGTSAIATGSKDPRRLTPKPPLGWNSYDSYLGGIDERALLANLEVFAQRLKPAGYEYFVIDERWFAPTKDGTLVRLDAYGRPLPSEKKFPRGFAAVVGRVHELGLKFGLHMIRGIPRNAVSRNLPILGTRLHAPDIWDRTKEHPWDVNYVIDTARPGAQEYYNSLINLLAEWQVDFIKYDDIVPFPRDIEAVARAIEGTKRDMVLSLSPGDLWRLKDMPVYRRANILRITGDIWDRRSDLERSFDNWEKLQEYGGDGFWLDLDMIPFGKLAIGQRPETADPGTGVERMDRLTAAQKQTFITQRAMAASPLFMGGDLPSTDELSFELIANPDMLACNQNGVVGETSPGQEQPGGPPHARQEPPGQRLIGHLQPRRSAGPATGQRSRDGTGRRCGAPDSPHLDGRRVRDGTRQGFRHRAGRCGVPSLRKDRMILVDSHLDLVLNTVWNRYLAPSGPWSAALSNCLTRPTGGADNGARPRTELARNRCPHY